MKVQVHCRLSLLTALLLCLSLISHTISAQYIHPPSGYKNIFLDDFCKALSDPNTLVIDVRTASEFKDSARSGTLNIGRIKGSINISVSDIGKRIKELETARDKNIYLICSHSRRSRMAADSLVKAGFKNVFNVNGGMSYLNLSFKNTFSCITDYYETKLPYRFIQPRALIEGLRKKTMTVIDVDPDSVYNGTDRWQSLPAKLKTAKHIPVSQLQDNLPAIDPNKPVVLVDADGELSSQAAKLLCDKGFKEVYVLAEGIDNLLRISERDLPGIKKWIEPRYPFALLTPADLYASLKKSASVILIDTRTAIEFENKATNNALNLGSIKNAINITYPFNESLLSQQLPDKSASIVLYARTTHPSTFAAAKLLREKGYSRVQVLYGGLFELGWQANNIRGKDFLQQIIQKP